MTGGTRESHDIFLLSDPPAVCNLALRVPAISPVTDLSYPENIQKPESGFEAFVSIHLACFHFCKKHKEIKNLAAPSGRGDSAASHPGSHLKTEIESEGACPNHRLTEPCGKSIFQAVPCEEGM